MRIWSGSGCLMSYGRWRRRWSRRCGLARTGGGTTMIDSRAVLAAMVYVLTTGCAWRHLPAGFGVAVPTAHRRFAGWTRAGFWRRLHTAALDQLGAQGRVDCSQPTADAAHV